MVLTKMTITRGLVELKLLDKKINSKIKSINFVGAVQGKKDITTKFLRKEELENESESGLQSIKVLIERRKKIKSLIVSSNIEKKVTINDKKYTITDVIEKKNSIGYKKELLKQLLKTLTKMMNTKGLVELKLLDKSINDKIKSNNFVGTVQGEKDITTKFLRKEELENEAKFGLQSIKDLIKRRKKIKSLIVVSNTETKVTISNKMYTVADAIERRNSIGYEKELLRQLRYQLEKTESEIIRQNCKMEETLDNLLGQQLILEKKKTEDAEVFVKSYKELNEYKIFDPISIKKTIKNIEEEIDMFLAEVDFILSESNATTFIEVDILQLK